VTLEDLSKLIKLEKALSLKLKNNLKKVVSLEFKEDKIVNKINKFNLLLDFLIQFKNETISCCCYNIVTKNLFNLVFIEFRNLLMTFATLDCVNKVIDKRISLF